MEILSIVEYWTTAVTFLMMASGLPACYTMYKKKSTKDVPYIFFLICTMNSLFGACYGTLIGNYTLFIINSVGFLLWGFYILVYLFVSKTKLRSVFMVVAMMLLAGAHLKYVGSILDARQMTATLGQIMFIWSNILTLTPLLDIISVVKQGTSEGMSVSLLVGCSLASVSWFFYGYLLKDVYIYGPNIPGTLVNLGKFVALFAYRKPSQPIKVD
ncbi:hypothetical protein SNE40_011980 [Patella caerulea]|uniref:Sugar transporter SWEET1 n=1 Tax=Patella caerulea TaxID=87958 RepID=A0AAN8JKU8_PATCE